MQTTLGTSAAYGLADVPTTESINAQASMLSWTVAGMYGGWRLAGEKGVSKKRRVVGALVGGVVGYGIFMLLNRRK